MGAFDHLEWTYDGAFEQLFGLGTGEFEQNFSKNLNARGLPGGEGGMLKLRFDWYIRGRQATIDALIGNEHYPIWCLSQYIGQCVGHYSIKYQSSNDQSI